MSDTPTAASVEGLESRVLFALVDGELHRPPTALVATGDLNGDSVPDLVVLEKHHIVHRDLAARGVKEDVYVWKVKTRLSGGDDTLGPFDTGDDVGAVTNPLALSIADLDGDGAPDLVVTQSAGPAASPKTSLLVLPTDGKGGLKTDKSGAPITSSIALPSTVNPRATIAADVDGDGRFELAVFGFEPQPIAASAKKLKPQPNVVLVSGASVDGRFPAGPRQTLPLTGLSDLTSIAYDDLTGDRATDFAVADDSTNQLLIWSPRSNKMAAAQNNPLYEDKGLHGNNPLAGGRLLGTGDLDGDGKVDLIATPGGNDLSIANLTDAGKLSPVRTTQGIAGLPATLARTPGVTVGDVNGDGLPDLVAASADGSLYVAINTTSKTAKLPTFSRGFRKASLPIRWMAPEAITLADFDKDGRLDVLATNQTRTEFAILLARQDAKLNTYFEHGDRPTESQFAVGDLNGDHKADLVSATPVHVVSFTAGGDIKEDVYVWKLQTRLGQGDGTFSDSVATLTLDDTLVQSLAVGDFDGDGKADVAVLTAREAGSGLATGRRGREAGSGIATGRRQYQVLRAFAGNGRGGITDPGPDVGKRTIVFPHVLEVSRLAAVDLDRDGIDDLAAVGHVISPRDAASGLPTGRRLAVVTFLAAKNNPFSRTSLTPVGTPDDPTLDGADTILAAGDLDGDGAPDLIVAPRDHASGLPTGRRMAILSPGHGGGGSGGTLIVKIVDNPLYQSSGSSGENPLFENQLIAAGDVDGDGRVDLLAATKDALYLSSYDAKTGSFLPPGPCKSSGTPSSLLSTTLLAGDLDGDGKMDLLSFDSPAGYTAAFNTSAAGAPAYTWAPHRILPGA